MVSEERKILKHNLLMLLFVNKLLFFYMCEKELKIMKKENKLF